MTLEMTYKVKKNNEYKLITKGYLINNLDINICDFKQKDIKELISTGIDDIKLIEVNITDI